ncbi:MAG: DUF1329 domain-containing protein [Pseudomonadota bacterium]
MPEITCPLPCNAARVAFALVGLAFTSQLSALDQSDLDTWLASDQVFALSPGEVVTYERLGELADVVPPGYIEKLQFPELRLDITARSNLAPHERYIAATEKFAGQATLSAAGELENYRAGRPFSEEQIVSADPATAGSMVAWNGNYRWLYYGYRSEAFDMCYMTAGDGEANLPDDWGGKGSCDHKLSMNFHRVYISHLAQLPEQDYRMDVGGSDRFYFKDVMRITDPFDMAGTAFMIERPLKFGEDDQVQSYLPGERRVRRLSARERADAFIGSDFTLDDLEAWSGKVAEYNWQYLGTRSILGVVNSRWPYSHFQGPLSDIPEDNWELRDTYVLVATPKWEDHPYAYRVMFFDKQTYVVLATLVFNRTGDLWKVLYPIYAWRADDDDVAGHETIEPGNTVLHWRSSVSLDVLNNKSSVTRSYGTDMPTMEASAVRRVFSASKLTGGR